MIQVKHCEVCQKSKRKFDKPAAPLHPIPVSDTWNKLGIDLIELTITPRGNRYIITLTDYFSKWAEAEAIPTKEGLPCCTVPPQNVSQTWMPRGDFYRPGIMIIMLFICIIN